MYGSRMMATPLLLLAGALHACSQPTDPVPEPTGPRAVLFVGNSLTYTHDLPTVVREIAVEMGEAEPPEVHMVALPNFGLEQHWANPDSRVRIEQAGWWRVVLQQGPSALPSSRVNLKQWTRTLAEAIRAAGSEPALLSVWPQEERAFDFPASIESYRQAAQENNAILLPGGAAWVISLRDNPDIDLYHDNLHPTTAGTYLTALVIYGRLYGRTPAGITGRLAGTSIDLSADVATRLQQSAAKALSQ